MENEQLITGAWIMGGTVAFVVLVWFTLIMPWSVYSAQKWAHRCFKELEEMNKRLERIEKRGL